MKHLLRMETGNVGGVLSQNISSIVIVTHRQRRLFEAKWQRKPVGSLFIHLRFRHCNVFTDTVCWQVFQLFSPWMILIDWYNQLNRLFFNVTGRFVASKMMTPRSVRPWSSFVTNHESQIINYFYAFYFELESNSS